MAVPAGLTFAFWGVDYDNPPDLGVVAYLVGADFDPAVPDGALELAVENDLELVEGFDYATTPGDGDLEAPAEGSYLIFIDYASLPVENGGQPNAETYGWDPFDEAVVGTNPGTNPGSGGGGGLDDYPLDPGLTPSTYDPAAVAAPSFQDCPISADNLADGTLHQRFDTRAFPDLGDRLTGTLDDGVQVPEPARATVS